MGDQFGNGRGSMEKGVQQQDFGEHTETSNFTIERLHTESSPIQQARGAHQRLVFADPAAFRYLEEDPSTTVLERRRRLKGYELYFVEQWACSRVHPTFVITTYTGLEHHSIIVGVLSVPTDEEAWSPRLRVYLKAISKYHARAKETPLGTLMVTNLSGFPSALAVMSVPDGDLRNHREIFFVNENLKRMGCSGRAGLNLSPPTSATQAKFRELYHTSDQIPINGAVVELVKLCQAALMSFGKLAPEYADGLLCDVTEKAISDWWADIGSDYFNIDPADGVLGPTTVGAMLGLLMGARNRLHSFGAPVAKDVFDIYHTKRAVAYFQKSQKLERTRRLDRQTLDRLHKVTAKAANSDGWAVPRAVKSTVAELSGKGGELVNGREKAGIAEIETIDIDDFIRLGSGERFKWLWHGKPRKNDQSDALTGLDDGLVFEDEEHGGGWTGQKRGSIEDDFSLRHVLSNHMYLPSHGSQTSLNPDVPDQALRRTVLKNMTGKVTDARSGLGRIRDAVSRKGHHHRHSKDGNGMPDDDSLRGLTPRDSLDQNRNRPSDASYREKSPIRSDHQSTAGSEDSSRQDSKVPGDDHRFDGISHKSFYGNSSADIYDQSSSSLDGPAHSRMKPRTDIMNLLDHADGITLRPRAHGSETIRKTSTLSADDTQAIDHMEHFEWASSKLPPLRTTKSFSTLIQRSGTKYWENRFPRRMSFSAMTDILYSRNTQDDMVEDMDNPDTALAKEKISTLEAQAMEGQVQCLKTLETSWVESKVAQIEAFDRQCGNTQSKMDDIYHHRMSENHDLQHYLHDLMEQKKLSLTDAIKDVETLDAKLEYELQALQSKVEDVENGIDEFERHVIQLEVKAGELDETNEDQASWMRWLLGFEIF